MAKSKRPPKAKLAPQPQRPAAPPSGASSSIPPQMLAALMAKMAGGGPSGPGPGPDGA